MDSKFVASLQLLKYLLSPTDEIEKFVNVQELISGRVYKQFAQKYIGWSHEGELDFFHNLLSWLASRESTGFNPEMISSLAEILCDNEPFYDTVHLQLIDYLFKASIETVTVSRVKETIKTMDDFHASRDTPIDLEDALCIWISKTINKSNVNLFELVTTEQTWTDLKKFYRIDFTETPIDSFTLKVILNDCKELSSIVASLIYKEVVLGVAPSGLKMDNDIDETYEQVVTLDDYMQEEQTLNTVEYGFNNEKSQDHQSEQDLVDILESYVSDHDETINIDLEEVYTTELSPADVIKEKDETIVEFSLMNPTFVNNETRLIELKRKKIFEKLEQRKPLRTHKEGKETKFHTRGNLVLVRNALQQLLKGKTQEKLLDEILGTLETQKSNEIQYVILIRGENSHLYRGLYVFASSEKLIKLHGMPSTPIEIKSSECKAFFKYQTSSRSLAKVPTKSLSIAVQAVSLQ